MTSGASGADISITQITFLSNQARACGQAQISTDNDNLSERFDLSINAGKGISIGPLGTTQVTVWETGNYVLNIHNEKEAHFKMNYTRTQLNTLLQYAWLVIVFCRLHRRARNVPFQLLAEQTPKPLEF